MMKRRARTPRVRQRCTKRGGEEDLFVQAELDHCVLLRARRVVRGYESRVLVKVPIAAKEVARRAMQVEHLRWLAGMAAGGGEREGEREGGGRG